SPTHYKVKSLSGKIFYTVLVFTVAIILMFSAVISVLFYFSYENEAEAGLTEQAFDVAAYLNSTPSSDNVPALLDQIAGQVRYTLIDADGNVLFDSASDGEPIENHADRPEVIEAEETGQASVVRYSKTLETDSVYAAVRLDDGSIVRLAETRHSLVAFMSTLIGPMIIALFVIVLLVFVLSRVLTARIMKPIDALNFAEPLENEIYEEMDPLLERIDEQQTMLKQQTREIARAETMRRDFSSNVSHEMKTPLQVISGYAELMKNNMTDPADQQRFAGLIYEEAQAMRSLINDVLVLSRLDEMAMGERDQIIDLYALSKAVAVRLEGFADQYGVKIHVEGERACIAGIDTLAEEMIYNLIENGIRYNHKGGTVTVQVGNDAMGPILSVSDTGLGIPKEMHDKVFERFFRVDKSRSKETGGTGLGLAIVKHAVLYHGGTIELESDSDRGTKFIVRLPGLE
ncbi:MAG: ATP-binding protein, partial [Raoultibacter sp.]